MKILAPFDGVAGIRSVDVGDYVKDGADIVNIEDLSPLWVDFRAARALRRPRCKPGQAVEVTLDALPGRSFSGQVEALDSQVDANGRSLLVRARLDNPGALLQARHVRARARRVRACARARVVVPEEALVPQGGKQYLIKVVDGPDGRQGRRSASRRASACACRARSRSSKA